MIKVEKSVIINKPAEEVFAFITAEAITPNGRRVWVS
jgi:uncharacterized protein YndB with AHSA1/START domain